MRCSQHAAALDLALALALGSSFACRIEPKEQKVFEDSSQPAQTATRDWNGEAITIHNEGIDDGVNNRSSVGGVEVLVSPDARRVSVEAIFAAHADDDKEPNARQSIADVVKTLAIVENAASFDVRCGHGETHGTSRAAGSGCVTLRITIPAGTAAQPHALVIASGSGAVRVGLAGAADAASLVRMLDVKSTGLGEVDVRVRPAKDAMLGIAGDHAVRVALPSDFSAKKVVFAAADTGSAEVGTDQITTDFPGMKSGVSYPASGPSANAAAELNVFSDGPSLAETIEIVRF